MSVIEMYFICFWN